jgi:hypothetical protein
VLSAYGPLGAHAMLNRLFLDSTPPPTAMSPAEILMREQLAVSSRQPTPCQSMRWGWPRLPIFAFQEPGAVDNYLGGLETRPPMAAGADLSDAVLIKIDCPKGSNGLECSGRGRFAPQPHADVSSVCDVTTLWAQLQHKGRRMHLLIRGAVPFVQLRMPGIAPVYDYGIQLCRCRTTCNIPHRQQQTRTPGISSAD